MKPRHHIRLDDDLTQRLDALATEPGSSKSAIVSDALRAYLSRKAGNEVDDLVKRRLDRISQAVGRVERDQEVLMETLGQFIHHHFTITAPMPEADKASRARGQAHFDEFIKLVCRRIASGKGLRQEINEPVNEEAAS
ncbi:MAG: ribbon-helix-helix domain-containing protein [Rhodospirillaceae bacterium]|nr:ribbon-helix-helix domain-containing protein [Rhodospirillaceae bacterium]